MEKIEAMKEAASVGSYIFKRIQYVLEPGVTTAFLNEQVISCLQYKQAKPAFKGYGYPPYPAESCISVNDAVCHGLPGDQIIGGGDLVSVDVGIQVEGYIVDACRTFQVGEISEEADHLNYWTKTALQRALRHIKAGVRWNDVAKIIENTAKNKGLGIVREMTGHGVGGHLHEDPMLRNYVCSKGEKTFLEEGQTICVEPMFTLGDGSCKVADDKWTVLTKDGSLASHWEHTIVVTENGCEILL